MITTEDTYDVAGKILEIPVTAIRRAKDNVRTDLGDLEELAASIREVGVLQAITVIADPTGETFEVLMGNRRHAASELAGVMTIPAVIRTKPKDTKRVITMLIENVHRADLTALDEARTFARLEELGVDQADIATRVGCSQSHVSKRLSLLDLPAKARKMLTDGELNIGDAVELAKLADIPAAMKAALDTVAHGGDAEHAVKHELSQIAGEKALDEAKAACQAKKIKVLHVGRSGGMNYAEGEKRRRALDGLAAVVKTGAYCYGKKVEFPKPAAHAKEPCHAVTLLLGYDGKIERAAYCTDPKRHTAKGDSELKAAKPDPPAKRRVDPEVAAAEAGQKDATRARREFVTDLLQNRKLDRAALTARTLKEFALSCGADHKERAQLLGLDLTGRDPSKALEDYIAGGADETLRACLAVIVQWHATSRRGSYRPEHDGLLEFGYEPTEWERAQAVEAAEEDAIAEAWDAHDRALDRAQELADGPGDIPDRVKELTEELDTACGAARAREIQAELDAMFVELNNIQPGDVVDHDGEGHTIEREPVDDVEEELDEDDDVNEDRVLCAFPECTLDDEHDGDHDVPPAWAKPPKDCGPKETWARQHLDSALTANILTTRVHEIDRELRAGVDEDQADQLGAELLEIIAANPLDAYTRDSSGPSESKSRELIAELPSDHARVAEIQQELYRGITLGRASSLNRELKELRKILG